MSTPSLATMNPTPRPPAGEFVTDQVLSSLMQQWWLALGFTGTSNPSDIWRQLMGDQQRAFAYMRELEEKDSDVGACVEEMKLSVLRRERQLSPGDDSPEAATVRDFIQQQMDRVDMDQLCDSLLDAPFYGVAIVEMMFRISPDAIELSEARDCPQELFSFNTLGLPQVGPLRFSPDGSGMDGAPVPEEKFLVWSYRPRSRNRRGQPILRKVFWESWFKRQALRFWLRFAEKGPGTAAVKYANGASDDEQRKALAVAEAINNSTAIALPDSVGLITELLTQARAQNPAVYKELHQQLQYSIARRIKGETLTSFGNEGGTGSKAQGQTHSETKEERSLSMCVMLERVIQDQMVKRLVLWNFGPNAPMPTWTIEKSPPENLKVRIEIDNLLQQMGYQIPKSYAQEIYGVPSVGEGDEALVRTATAPPALQSPGGSAQFSDEAAVRRELKDFDRLLQQLQDAALPIYEQRVRELAGQAGGVL